MIQNQSLSLTELGLLGIIKFIWIMGAGVLTGILCGILGSLLTKWCSKDYQNLGKAFITNWFRFLNPRNRYHKKTLAHCP